MPKPRRNSPGADSLHRPILGTSSSGHCHLDDAFNTATVDMVVVAMTSNLTPTPHGFLLTSADLVAGSLNRSGRVRADKIYTLDQRMVVAKFGKVNDATLDRIRHLLATLCGP